MSINLNEYIDVPERIAEFRAKYPEGSLQPWDKAKPYTVEKIGDQIYIVVVAAAYRSKDDQLPGVGMAYEVFPGKTPYTRGSELQNCETSAWGRAIVAALAADTKRGVASAHEVRNRVAEREQADPTPQSPADQARARLLETLKFKGISPKDAVQLFADKTGETLQDSSNVKAIQALVDHYRSQS